MSIQVIHEGPNKAKAGETWVGIDYADLLSLQTINDQLKDGKEKNIPTVIAWIYSINPARRSGAGDVYEYWPAISWIKWVYGQNYFRETGNRMTDFSRFREGKPSPERVATPDKRIIGLYGFYIAYGDPKTTREFIYIGNEETLTDIPESDPTGFQAELLRDLLYQLSRTEEEIPERRAIRILLLAAQLFENEPTVNMQTSLDYFIHARSLIGKKYKERSDEELPFTLKRPDKRPKPFTKHMLDTIIEEKLALLQKEAKKVAQPAARPAGAAPAGRPSGAQARAAQEWGKETASLWGNIKTMLQKYKNIPPKENWIYVIAQEDWNLVEKTKQIDPPFHHFLTKALIPEYGNLKYPVERTILVEAVDRVLPFLFGDGSLTQAQINQTVETIDIVGPTRPTGKLLAITLEERKKVK